MKNFKEALEKISKLEEEMEEIQHFISKVGQLYLERLRTGYDPSTIYHLDRPPKEATFTSFSFQRTYEGSPVVYLNWEEWCDTHLMNDGYIIIEEPQFWNSIHYFWEIA